MKQVICSDLPIVWTINGKKKLSDEDVNFLKSFFPAVYWSDDTCRNWCFDTKMPSGKWIEDINPTITYGRNDEVIKASFEADVY